MSIQRRRGELIRIYPTVTVTDRRGDTQEQPGEDYYEVRAWIVPDRSSRAEVPGQQEIDVYRVGIDPHTRLENVNLWSRVVWDGDDWDLVSPPAHRRGSRHVRHQTIVIRRRTPA